MPLTTLSRPIVIEASVDAGELVLKHKSVDLSQHGNAIGTTSHACSVEFHLRACDPSVVITAVNSGGETPWRPVSNWLRRYFSVPEGINVEVTVEHNRKVKSKMIRIYTE
jgi:hypothetical protein